MEGEKTGSSKLWVAIALILFVAVVVLSYMVVQNKLQPQGQVIKEVIKEVPQKIESYKVEGFFDNTLDILINEEPISAQESEILLSQEEVKLE